MFHFYTSWKRQNTKGFLTLSGGIKMEDRPKMGEITIDEQSYAAADKYKSLVKHNA